MKSAPGSTQTSKAPNTPKKQRLRCEICSLILKSQFFYERHKKTKHERNRDSFICDFDGKTFERKNYLRIHIERHKEQIYTCNACCKSYTSRLILRRHLQSHLEKFPCPECDATFNHKSLLKNHIATHKTDLPYKCKYCTRLFKNHAGRNNHHQTAHKNKDELNYKCQQCQIYFESKEDLRIHSFIHFEKDIKSCPFCDQIFKTTKSLNIHMQKHSQKKFQCESCRESFTFKSGLNKHMRLNRCKGLSEDLENNDDYHVTQNELAKIAHEQLRSISVNKKEITEIALKTVAEEPKSAEVDQITHDDNDIDIFSSDGESLGQEIVVPTENILSRPKGRTHNTYICDHCGESIKYHKNLVAHMRNNHLGSKYQCQKCPEIFRSKSGLKDHSLAIHGIKIILAPEKSHVCDVCQASFRLIGNLKRHSLTHTKVRNYLCDTCPKSFKSQSSLKVHKESVHAAVKLFVNCPFCKVIIQEKSLKIHIFNRHTEEGQKKPFSCNECAKSFKTEFLLKRHVDLQHVSIDRGVIYDCKICGLAFNRQRDLRAHSFDHFDGPVHVCECGKKFKNKRLLLVHASIHTAQDTRFSCLHCDAVFKTIGGRRKHLTKHHKNLNVEDQTLGQTWN